LESGIFADLFSLSPMKTVPPTCPEPESGRKYWRSLDQLAETPEFRTWVEREFPAGASEWEDPLSRRHFVKIMSASFLLGGLGMAGSGCRRPEQHILPFGKMPENYVHGVAQFYATAMPTRTGAIPLVVKANDGRPTKVEGNVLHPDSNGGTDRYAQASILNLYDPDRTQTFVHNGSVSTPEAALDALSALGRGYQAKGGQGLAFLVEPGTSPSRARLQKLIAQKMPQARWDVYDPLGLDASSQAAATAFGAAVKPFYLLDKARVILSLDCDFIGAEDDAYNHIRRFTKGRKIEKPGDTLNRLYTVESLMTLTGVVSDHRLRAAPSLIPGIARAIAAEVFKQVGGGAPVTAGALPAGVDPKWVSECAQDLLRNRGSSLVMAGHRQPPEVQTLAHALNSALGNIGKTVQFHALPETKQGTIEQLAQALNSGAVETLVIVGANPVYTAPVDLNWAATQRKAKNVIRLGYYQDETFAQCDWHFPMAHYLESWGDALSSDGTLVPIQPLIAPLFGGLTELEVLARLAGETVTAPYDIVRATFAETAKKPDAEAAWRKFLHDGFLPESAAKPATVNLSAQALNSAAANAPMPGADRLDVIFHRDYSLDDGRYSNNGWLQEMPDPITKMVWDNAVLISRKTAVELKVENMQVVEVQMGNRTVRGPIWIQPGQADYTLGLALGYGRSKVGRVGQGIGFNAYTARQSANLHLASGATLKKTGATYTLACTQDHWSLEGRPIVREANIEQFRQHPDFAQRMQSEEPKGAGPLYPNPFDQVKGKGLHQWGMSIDLNSCVGCQACMMACQSENNVPIVGKDQVRRGREMHWIRIDRYYSGVPAQRGKYDTYHTEQQQQFEQWIDDPQAVTQPMLCQHCEAAPCENVCPVNATVHDQEGLNLMVYNRCVGTRYCSNNCPYKVRRFNYFDFNKRPLNALYKGPFGHRKDDEWDLMKMIKNPDVTVRMRGVMEKCTYCIQRIEGAKIVQKVKAGASGEVIVPTDSFTTACAQACPAGAIVFGNLNDKESRVSKLKEQERNYSVLEFLLTKPRTTYLARVRNPNPAMPDYMEAPLSFQSYKEKMGDPFEQNNVSPEVNAESRRAGKGEL
jgi:MoCo/4Fe-4S cofactor protein with predicted Tat translocation signal